MAGFALWDWENAFSFYVAAIVKPFGALFSFLVSPASLLVRIGLGCVHTGSVCE
jgi:hypothetical protein